MKKLVLLLAIVCPALNAYIDSQLDHAVKSSRIDEVKRLLVHAQLTKNEQKALLIIANRRTTDLKHSLDEYNKPATEYETTEYDKYYNQTGKTKVTEKKKYIAKRNDIHYVPVHNEGIIALWGLGGMGAGAFTYLLLSASSSTRSFAPTGIIPIAIGCFAAAIMTAENEIAYRQRLNQIYQEALDIEVEIQKIDTY